MSRLACPLLLAFALPLAACSSTGNTGTDAATLDNPATTGAATASAGVAATGTDTAAVAAATGNPAVGASTGGASTTDF